MNEINRYENVHEDYELIRSELLEMLREAKDALSIAKDILESTEHPRAVETYSGLLKNVATINAQLLDLTKTYKDILTERQPLRLSFNEGDDQQSITQNVFTGTTNDLLRKLQSMNEIVDITPENE